MKKYFIILTFILLSFAFKAEAKLVTFQSTQTEINLTDNLQLQIASIDKNKQNWVVNWSETAEDNVFSLQIYPSQKTLIYSLKSLDQSQIVYKNTNEPNDWRTTTNISAKKILVKLDPSTSTTPVINNDSLLVFDNRKFITNSQSTDKMLTIESNNSVTIDKAMAPLQNQNLERVSKFYKINTTGDYNVKFYYNDDDFRAKDVYAYDTQTKVWTKLVGYNDVKEKFISVEIRGATQYLTLAIFADLAKQDGIASFYDQSRYKYFNYKNGNFAASRDYPKGTKLKVTRLKTGQSIIVEVNDYGPELATGRTIDLDTQAFKQLSSLGAGLIYVKVELYDPSN